MVFGALLLAPLPAHSASYGHEGSSRFGHFHRRFDHRGFGGRFGYPSCFGYPYCPYGVPGCVWSQGYWIAQPYIGPDGIERFQQVWIPAGCY